MIYPARPMRCRLYPIIIESLKADKIYLDPKCPGLGEGNELKAPRREIMEYIVERRKHYEILYKYIIGEGMEPLEALKKALEELWEKVKA